eukprot:Nk52_evm37s1129 gene=Nk52_evmTU37s1129
MLRYNVGGVLASAPWGRVVPRCCGGLGQSMLKQVPQSTLNLGEMRISCGMVNTVRFYEPGNARPSLLPPGSAIIDYRSDTVTLPTKEMLEYAMSVTVGDDVYGEDPSVNRLQEYVASICDKEAALFVVTATMANQVAVASNLHLASSKNTDIVIHEVICDRRAHIYCRENGGIAHLSKAQANPLVPSEPLSPLTASLIEENLHTQLDFHQPLTTLVTIENPYCGGLVFPYDEICQISDLAKMRNLRLHLDGTRLWNACVASGIDLKDYCKHFDTVTLCLSKGLGCPMGSILVGCSKTINVARQFRKAFGGAWRQAGYMAAAGEYGVKNNWERMADDHKNAVYLTRRFQELGFVLTVPTQTNMASLSSETLPITFEEIAAKLKEKNILIPANRDFCRFMTHLQITKEHVDFTVECVKEIIDHA